MHTEGNQGDDIIEEGHDVISTGDHLPNMSLNNNHGQRHTN
jgi:hypothetical protein